MHTHDINQSNMKLAALSPSDWVAIIGAIGLTAALMLIGFLAARIITEVVR